MRWINCWTIAKYTLDLCLIVLSMGSVASERPSGVEMRGRMELSSGTHESSA